MHKKINQTIRLFTIVFCLAIISPSLYAGESAWNPYPESNSVNVPWDVTLTWSPGDSAISHDIYIGTDFNDVNDANSIIHPNVDYNNVDVNSYDPPGDLEVGNTYYWRVDEVNGVSITRGLIWNFMTDLDCNGNGIPDPDDISTGTSLDCNGNGVPDECDLTISELVFALTTPMPVNQDGSYDLAVGDLDGDDDLDLAVANRISPWVVSIFLNNGDGTFSTPVHYTHDNTSRAIKMADLDNDDDLDLIVVTDASDVAILLNNGDGSFAGATMLDSGFSFFVIEVEDLNGDNYPDLVASNNNGNNIKIFMNNETGGFLAGVEYDLGHPAGPVAAGDLNGDGFRDLVVGNYPDGEYVTVMYNNSNGTFGATTQIPTQSGPYTYTMVITDLDGDLDLDISTFGMGSMLLSLVLNNGDGTFASPINYNFESILLTKAEDLNGDGYVELVLANKAADEVQIMTNNGDGIFEGPFSIDPNFGHLTSVSSGDIDGDSIPDLIAVGSDGIVLVITNITVQQHSLDCNGNGIPDECDIAEGDSNDINANGIPDECELDCNGNGVPDEFDIAIGTSTDLNSNGIPDECEPDCNGNGVPDDWDIATGTSLDCNGNWIPDECDLDCNGNGVPDDLDISQGTSQDMNGDGIPDECQVDVRVEPVVTLDDPSGTSEVRDELPGSWTGMPDVNDTFYVEIWASDIGEENTGLTSVYVDISFCGEMNAVSVNHGTMFNMFTDGTIGTGIVDEFGGSGTGAGIEPNWVRVGWIEMKADEVPALCTIELQGSSSGIAALGRGLIDPFFIRLGDVTLSGDCNGNGVPDPDDISTGTSLDCNGNWIPDECDIAEGRSGDCNGNEVPDECDIESGASEDLNLDGIPDECQLDVHMAAVATLVNPSGTTEVRSALPETITEVVRGNRYYVEVWASDVGQTNEGITSAYVDVVFCVDTNAISIGHGSVFDSNTSGTIQSGIVDEFGGAASPNGVGIEPNWVRVGWVEMQAELEASDCNILLLPSSTGVSTAGGGLLDWAYVDINSIMLDIIAPMKSYDLDDDNSIGVGDFSYFIDSWLETVPPADTEDDFDCDDFVGTSDLSWFATGWMKDTNDPTILYPPCSGGGGMMMTMSSMGDESGDWEATDDIAIELVLLSSPSGADTLTTLPDSVSELVNGQTYYVEMWVSDVGDIDTGVTSAYIDVSLPDDAVDITGVSYCSIFDLFRSGTSNGTGDIDELGGSTFDPGVGMEPEWARVATIEVQAHGSKPCTSFAVLPSFSGVSAYGRGGIDWTEIPLGNIWMGGGDVDYDGDVDLDDIAELTSYWLESEDTLDIWPYPNGDGTINLFDFCVLADCWLQGTVP